MKNFITKEDLSDCSDFKEVFYTIDGKIEKFLDDNEDKLEKLPDEFKDYAYIIPEVKYILNAGFSSYYYHCEESYFLLAIKAFKNLGLTKASDILNKAHNYYLEIKKNNSNLSKDAISQEYMCYENKLIKDLETDYFNNIDYEFIETYIGEHFAKLYKMELD